MLVERINKETTDIARIVGDMLWWLDPGETITEILSQEIIQGMSGWSEAPYPPPNSPPAYDPTPVMIRDAEMDASSTQLIVFTEFGTPGLAYTLRFVLRGTSTREVTIELGVQVTGVPPVRPMPLPPPDQGAGGGSNAAYLNILGGTMQGPLYLFEDPAFPTEAATRAYVDSKVASGGGGGGGGGGSSGSLPLTGGTLTGPLFLPVALPTIDTQATTKLYVDERDDVLQGEIELLAENLLFVGQCHVLTDTTLFTVVSGITPSPGPLPPAQPSYKGYYVIVVDNGRPPVGSNIPADDYTQHDWLICDGTVWVHLKLGLKFFTASEIAVIPPIQGNQDVQAALTWLNTNNVASWNTRTGAVTMTLADVTGVGGAPLASPTFTGIPSAPTATAGTNTTQLATTAFVLGQVAAVSSGVTTWNTRTGNVTFTTKDFTDVGGATTAYVDAKVSAGTAGVTSFNTRTGAVTLTSSDVTGVGGAPLASPTFTGTPSAPTAGLGTNTAQIATTAFVMAQVASSVTGVATWNGRSGNVLMAMADVTNVLPSSNAAPSMNGAVAAGVSTAWARGDHVHPVDTSRYAASNPSGYQTAAQVSSAISGYLPLTGGALSGNLRVNNADIFSTSNIGLPCVAVYAQSTGGSAGMWIDPSLSPTQALRWGQTDTSGAPIQEWGAISLNVIGLKSTADVNFVMTGGAVWFGNLTNWQLTAPNALKPGGGSWAAASDARIKRDVVDYDQGLAAIMALRPVRYRYKDDWSRGGHRGGRIGDDERDDAEYVGLVAQEAEQAMPEMVKRIPADLDEGGPIDDLRMLDTTALTFAMLNAIKELAVRLDAMEKGGFRG